MSNISSQSNSPAHFDRFVVIHVATTCDEHGVYVTKDSAEVIELGWILLDAKSLEEVCFILVVITPIFAALFLPWPIRLVAIRLIT